MSAPKYMTWKRDNSPISIVVAAEQLTAYMFQITNNEKQFPKAYRYTLVQDIRNTLLRLNKHIYNGCGRKPSTMKDIRRMYKFQNKVNEDLLDLKALMMIAIEAAHIKNPEEYAKLYDNTVTAYNKWVRNNRREEQRVKERGTNKDTRTQRIAKQQAKTIARDPDGFAVLVQRTIT